MEFISSILSFLALAYWGKLYLDRRFEHEKAKLEDIILKEQAWLLDELRRLKVIGDWRKTSKNKTRRRREWQRVFKNCTTENDVKEVYRKLARKMHPDHGGSKDEMAALNALRDRAIEDIKQGWV